ncbi:hypothetical protein ACTDI4_04325 [Mesorhizobium sp. PUT5]|uniref:hypothetical protein n=1 Tax=Mesorhizobium sp. PUT5 TaxID=3454629 RepID=UPI003FA4BDC3
MTERLAGVTSPDALPADKPKHWPLFWVILIPGYLVNAATSSSWAMAAGYVAVPALVGGFLIRRATTWKGLMLGYLVFLGLLTMLVFQDTRNTLQDAKDSMRTACMTRNADVALLPAQDQKDRYCRCFSEKMAWPLLKHAGIAFLTFSKPEPIQSNPPMISAASAAAEVCAARI